MIRSILSLSTSNIFKSLLIFAGTTVFARILGPSKIGEYFLFIALLGAISLAADLGLKESLEKRISEGLSKPELISMTVLLKILLVSVSSIILHLSSGLLNRFFDFGHVSILILALILSEFAETSASILRGENNVQKTAAPIVVRYLIWLSVGIALLQMDTEVVYIMYSYLFGLLAQGIINIYQTNIVFGSVKYEYFSKLFSYGKYSYISDVNWYFFTWIDILIISFLLTSYEVGIYEIAWRVSSLMAIVTSAVGLTIFPKISSLDISNERKIIENILYESHIPALFIIFPGFIGIALLSEEILTIVFGTEYSKGALVLITLAGLRLVQGFYIIYSRSLHGLDRPDLAAKAKIVSILSNIILNFILIYYFGLIGAALATTFSLIINTILVRRYITMHINIKTPTTFIMYLLLHSLIMGTTIYILMKYISINNFSDLFIVILVGVIIYMFLSVLNPKTRKKLTNILQSNI
ncbi:polysaccharide biosynthesis C-terminal domain-containing protein [Halorubrum sp. T3]|uniref:oligosaccharide flippase family protein n=1 Tax=Halorubrum sp. T3 TaxID=1194088 RepID=UPI0009E3530E|nr:polysaccharide biosynthesis C-terminal domain-containing protein [Halorubrum sp. T3]